MMVQRCRLDRHHCVSAVVAVMVEARGRLDFGAVFDVVRTEALLVNQVGRRVIDVEI